MKKLLILSLVLVALSGCSTLPASFKQDEGVAILPLAFVNDSNLSESLVDMVLYFNHDKVPVTISPRNGYTVITTVYSDLKVTGISFHPKGRASMAGGIDDITPLSVDLSTQPGVVAVSPDRIEVIQGTRSSGGTYSYFFNWRRVAVGTLGQDKLRDALKKDGNAKVWSFQEDKTPVETP